MYRGIAHFLRSTHPNTPLLHILPTPRILDAVIVMPHVAGDGVADLWDSHVEDDYG